MACEFAVAQTDTPGADPAETERVLKAAVDAVPGDFEHVSAYVRFLNRQDRSGDAANALQSLQRNDSPAQLLRAETQWAQGDSDAMRETLKSIAEQDRPVWARAQEFLIEADYLEGQAKACVETCWGLLKSEPLNKTARLFLARLHIRHGAYDEALGMLDAADAAWRDDLEILECRAELFDAMARTDEAQQLRRSLVDKINAAPPDTARLLVAGAAAMRGIREPRAASQCLDLALSYAPTDPFTLIEKCRLFRQTSQVKVAAAAANAVMARHPKCAIAYYELAEVLWDMKYSASWVESLCQKALSLDNELLPARCRLIRYALIGGDFSRARELIEENRKFNRADPNTESLFLAAAILETNASNATISATEAPNAARVAAILGELCAARRDYRRSLDWFLVAVEKEKDNPSAVRGAGMASLHCGEMEAARTLLERAFILNRYDLNVKNTLDFLDDYQRSFTLTHGAITVGFRAGEAAAAEYTSYLAQQFLVEECSRFNVTLEGQLRVQLCPSADDLNVIALGIPACSSCGGPAGPDGSLALENAVFVVKPGPGTGRDHTFRFDEALHRGITECVIQRATGPRTPLWMRDGVARYTGMAHNPEWIPARLDLLLAALRSGKTYQLSALGVQSLGESSPLTRAYGAIAFQSWSDRYGAERIQELFAQLRLGKTWAESLETMFQKTLAKLDSETVADILKRYERIRPDAVALPSSGALLSAPIAGDDAEIERCALYLNAARYDDVLNGLAALLSKDAPPVRALFLAGRAALAKGDATSARTRIEAGLALDAALGENSATAKEYEALGTALVALGESDAAVRALRSAVELNPLDPADHSASARLLDLLAPKDPKPREYYEALALRVPVRRADAFSRLELARWYERQDDAKRALEWYRSAVGIRPGWAEAHAGLAPLAMKLNSADEAYHSYRAMLVARPDDTRSISAFQACAKQLGKENDAEEFLVRLKKAPSPPSEQVTEEGGTSTVQNDYSSRIGG